MSAFAQKQTLASVLFEAILRRTVFSAICVQAA